MGLSLDALVGRFAKLGNGSSQSVRLSELGSVAVAQVEPPYVDIARAGARYCGGCQVIASGIAPVAAIPTTTATLALYNSSSDKSLIVDHVAFALGSGTAAAGAALFIGLSNGTITAPSAASNYSSQCLGKKTNSSNAVWGAAVTFPSGTAWMIAEATFQLAAANVGQGDAATHLDGVLVPPGYALGFAILSGTGTSPLYQISAMWAELELDLE